MFCTERIVNLADNDQCTHVMITGRNVYNTEPRTMAYSFK